MQAITNPAVDALTEQRRAMAARLGVDSLFAVHRAINGQLVPAARTCVAVNQIQRSMTYAERADLLRPAIQRWNEKQRDAVIARRVNGPYGLWQVTSSGGLKFDGTEVPVQGLTPITRRLFFYLLASGNSSNLPDCLWDVWGRYSRETAIPMTVKKTACILRRVMQEQFPVSIRWGMAKDPMPVVNGFYRIDPALRRQWGVDLTSGEGAGAESSTGVTSQEVVAEGD